MELLKSAILILTIAKIYDSEGFSAGVNSNFGICGLQCGFGINGAIPNACQLLKSPGGTSYANSDCSKLSQLSETVCGFLRKKENFLKQLFASFQSKNSYQRCPLFSINFAPTIEKIKLPNTQTGSSYVCSPGSSQVQIPPQILCDNSRGCSENCNNCNLMV